MSHVTYIHSHSDLQLLGALIAACKGQDMDTLWLTGISSYERMLAPKEAFNAMIQHGTLPPAPDEAMRLLKMLSTLARQKFNQEPLALIRAHWDEAAAFERNYCQSHGLPIPEQTCPGASPYRQSAAESSTAISVSENVEYEYTTTRAKGLMALYVTYSIPKTEPDGAKYVIATYLKHSVRNQRKHRTLDTAALTELRDWLREHRQVNLASDADLFKHAEECVVALPTDRPIEEQYKTYQSGSAMHGTPAGHQRGGQNGSDTRRALLPVTPELKTILKGINQLEDLTTQVLLQNRLDALPKIMSGLSKAMRYGDFLDYCALVNRRREERGEAPYADEAALFRAGAKQAGLDETGFDAQTLLGNVSPATRYMGR